ncbi:MAG TPA: nitrite reductase small subunit NirD [Aquabacterium sp.]|nr:nitrite reductase small subunit NirD [Aquabacterium sp.]
MNAVIQDRSSAVAAWTEVCAADAIVPNTGVCALVAGRHIAIFRVGADAFYALDNIDPKSGASVLSRGLVGNLGEHLVVASPLYKNHFVLTTGECLEAPEQSVRAYPVEVRNERVWVCVP